MKKVLIAIALGALSWAGELPSYQCQSSYEASFIKGDGSIEPKAKKSSGSSRLNIAIALDGEKVKGLSVNGKVLPLLYLKGSYIYAGEVTAGGMNTWVLFRDAPRNKDYLSISKTYDFLGAPMTSYLLYSCERVNNTF